MRQQVSSAFLLEEELELHHLKKHLKNTILKVTLSKVFFRIQCLKPGSILVSAWPSLPGGSEEHSAFPVAWPGSGKWARCSWLTAGAVSCWSTLGLWQWVQWRCWLSQTSHRLPAESIRTKVKFTQFLHFCYRRSWFWMRTMKPTHESFQVLSIPSAY